MKVSLYMAMSVNGMIARKNGDEDFLSNENWKKFCDMANDFGNFIIGRKTYEAVKSWDEGYGFDDLVGVQKVVISENEFFKLGEGYILAKSPKDAIGKLKEKGFERILLTGGSNINNSFAKECLLDEIILNVEPAIVGEGIPLFASGDFEEKLKFISVDTGNSGIITLRYQVIK